jgi:para-aminobenzoate synthetase component I
MKIRNSEKFVVSDQDALILKALRWAMQHQVFNYFRPNNFSYPFQPYKHFLAVNSHQEVIFEGKDDFETLEKYVQNNSDYLIGHFSYDLKNQIEKLSSNNPDRIHFDNIGFYVPEHIIWFGTEITIESYGNPKHVYESIVNATGHQLSTFSDLKFKPTISKNEYIETVDKLKDHIIEGDVYEINYCQEFVANTAEIDPVSTFMSLIEMSPTPFSVLYKRNDHFLICASPERFLKKEQGKLISQPIKGTARRGENKKEDEIIKEKLKNNEKELAENMMIVDLVRNDLARSCRPGSIKVEEMFGVYTFNQLHQMISTVSGGLRDDVHFVRAIKNAFPMGSMTGAPKIKVMELIEQYEHSKRGLYSGSVGYILPNGDFDFNVVIRSILYNATEKVCSFHVGSAITFDSEPEAEYEECLLKALAITSIFQLENTN